MEDGWGICLHSIAVTNTRLSIPGILPGLICFTGIAGPLLHYVCNSDDGDVSQSTLRQMRIHVSIYVQ